MAFSFWFQYGSFIQNEVQNVFTETPTFQAGRSREGGVPVQHPLGSGEDTLHKMPPEISALVSSARTVPEATHTPTSSGKSGWEFDNVAFQSW